MDILSLNKTKKEYAEEALMMSAGVNGVTVLSAFMLGGMAPILPIREVFVLAALVGGLFGFFAAIAFQMDVGQPFGFSPAVRLANMCGLNIGLPMWLIYTANAWISGFGQVHGIKIGLVAGIGGWIAFLCVSITFLTLWRLAIPESFHEPV